MFRFFVNDFATTTQGVDITWAWQLGRHTVGAASNFTSTRVHSLLGGVIDRRRVASRIAGVRRPCRRRGYAVAMPIFFFSSASASAPAPGEGVDSALSMSSSMVPPTSASWS